MQPFLPLVLVVAVFAASMLGTRLMLGVLRRRQILDRPNDRSSHATPTPRGGGIAVTGVIVLSWAILEFLTSMGGYAVWLVLAGALGLAVLSWLDDLRSLSPLVRLAVQGIAVIAGLFALPQESLVFQGLLPSWLDMAATALAWMWFINLFNFMDGIDGISGIEAIAIGIGIAALGLFTPLDDTLLALAVAAAAAGFLVWNWPPARIFLGDVGSVPLGYLLGWLLLSLALAGHWAAAAILPLYYLADATLTLARRLARREKVWIAHRDHFYQQPVRKGASHLAVIVPVATTNLFLIGLACASVLTGANWTPVLAAGAVVVLLLVYLASHRGRPSARPTASAD